jgi:uncharacterized membrane protein YdbT with pleckstrin-like domain
MKPVHNFCYYYYMDLENKIIPCPRIVVLHRTVKSTSIILLPFIVLNLIVSPENLTTQSFLEGLFGTFLLFGIPLLIANVVDCKQISLFITDTSITIKRGIFNKHQNTIPLSNVQNIECSDSLYSRIFNLSHLKIWSASPGQINFNSPDIKFWLKKNEAQEIKDFIVKAKSTAAISPTQELVS